ncbi:hypothetical protein KX928_21380 [Roseobacter sp. YSTF-M11]|uniref:Uncharacterized protein n=1 Tax=Roseobacter insulae TaxID=2859783 RepID=A0A9X1G0D6_9RHOB|nr:hypothetical protein [Roseobacter insulae]MBW4710350.1 hypothetical protein [Roseobacter insulae]
MYHNADSRTLRQARCIRRAGRARLYAWLLMPVTAATFSAAMWSDPVLKPKLLSGLEDAKPIIEALMNGEFPTEEARLLQDAAAEKAAELNAKIAGLPVSRTPINRPEDDG